MKDPLCGVARVMGGVLCANRSPLSGNAGSRRAHATTAPICMVLLALLPSVLYAQAGARVVAGVHLEQNSSLQPGIEIGYSRADLLGGRPRLTASYTTSRLSVAFGSNGLAKDRFLVGAGWYFRPDRVVDPYIQLEAGYTRFDRDDPELFALLDNSAGILSLLFGLEARIGRGFGVYGDLGYSAWHSSTVYPLTASVGVNFRLQ